MDLPLREFSSADHGGGFALRGVPCGKGARISPHYGQVKRIYAGSSLLLPPIRQIRQTRALYLFSSAEGILAIRETL